MNYQFSIWTQIPQKRDDIYQAHRGIHALCAIEGKEYRAYMSVLSRPLRILIVDDHEQVLHALAAQLASCTEILVVGVALKIDEALQRLQLLQPDVVLVETKRADGRGLELIKAIHTSEITSRVVVLTSYFNEWERELLTCEGVKEYLLKDIGSQQLIEQITTLTV